MNKIAVVIQSNDSFFYHTNDKYIICDTKCCAKSSSTFDMPIFDLASNRVLVDKLNLLNCRFGLGFDNSYNGIGKYFCTYLSSLYKNDRGRYDKMITNPTIRLLIMDSKLLEEVKKILNKYK